MATQDKPARSNYHKGPRRSKADAPSHALTIQMRERQGLFLAYFAISGHIVRACLEAEVPRRTVYNWLATKTVRDAEGNNVEVFADPEFVALYHDARKAALQTLEAFAWECATEGVEDVKTVAGVREVVKRPDMGMLKFLLRALDPGKYGIQRIDTKVSGEITHVAQVVLYMPDNGRGAVLDGVAEVVE